MLTIWLVEYFQPLDTKNLQMIYYTVKIYTVLIQ